MKDRELAMEREENGGFGGGGGVVLVGILDVLGKGIECWCAKKKGMFIEMNIPRNENFTI